MKLNKTRLLLPLIALLAIAPATCLAAEDDTENRSGSFDIEAIMKETHEGENSLANRVKRGEGNEKEMHELIAVYRALYTLDPPRGKPKAWKKRIAKIVNVASTLQKNKNLTNTKQLAKVMDCNACHKIYKPKEEKK